MIAGRSKTVDRVLRGQLCTGCGLCASVSAGAIAMDDGSGYNRPVQTRPISVASETIIANACPGVVVEPWREVTKSSPYWGPANFIGVGHSLDSETRFRGSSGGVITALAAYALRSGLVDRVLHATADPANPTGNITVCSRSEADIIDGAGSRYAASSPLAEIESWLAEGDSFAFIGKPCDVSALRRLARTDPRIDRQVPLMLAFFCAGVPNRKGAENVVRAMGLDFDKLKSFRYRGHGWPGNAAAEMQDGRVAEMSYGESWGRYLAKEVQFRCKICPDAVGGSADISCADAWYGDDQGYPAFEEKDGRSLIMSRTERGRKVLNLALADGALAIESLSVGEIDKMQPSQALRKQLVSSRLAAMRVALKPTLTVQGTMTEVASAQAKPTLKIRNFLGMLRRIMISRP